jgi:hypothetical protein
MAAAEFLNQRSREAKTYMLNQVRENLDLQSGVRRIIR